MSCPRRHIGWLLLALLPLLSAFLISCSNLQRTVLAPPGIEGATFVGNQTCFDCHTNITRGFNASPHGRIHSGREQFAGMAGCESCHGPGSKHVAAGGGRGVFIVNPRQDPAACFSCHLQTHAEFNLPQHHPVREGKMNCVQCHDPHGMDIMKPSRGLAMARVNESCAGCHREQAKPHAFEHAALREGCTSCHQPHGSINAKMLAERDNNLCLKCHAQMPSTLLASGDLYLGHEPHSDKVTLGTCYSAGCHTAVHGSNIDRRLLY